MELKKALGVCLISLVSAALVVLVARALDSQAAARLEPELTRIANELEAIRRSGGGVATPDDAAASDPLSDGLVVYYFHGERCATCRSIESQAHKVVESDFAPQLASGAMAWRVVNYLTPAGKELQELFQVSDPVVVLVRMKAGEIDVWDRLDRVWALKDDPPAFAEYVRGEIQGMLDPQKTPAQEPSGTGDGEIPIPTDADEMPVPQ